MVLLKCPFIGFNLMKISKFNSTVEISDKYNLHYNALTDSFMLSRKGFVLSLNSSDEELELLTVKGFIVDDFVDEDEILRNRANAIILRDSSFHLTINPTLDCNFSCWYCYEEKHKGSAMGEEVLSSVKKLLLKLGKRYEHLHLSFFGGEPLLCFRNVIIPIHKSLDTICKENNCDYSTSFTTNGGIISNRILSYLETMNVRNIQITMDGHRSFHDKTRYFTNQNGSYDIIMNNINKLLKRNISVTLRINYTPENIHSIQDVANDVIETIHKDLRSLLIIRLHQVWQTTSEDLSSEIDDIIEYFVDHGIRALKPVFNNVYNPCYADYKHSALVNYNGDVFKCTAIDFLNTQREGYLANDGEIVWENDSVEKRLNSKFKSNACNSCRIRPICNGGCSQKALQFDSKSYCILGFDETKKDQVVKDRFVASLHAEKLRNMHHS